MGGTNAAHIVVAVVGKGDEVQVVTAVPGARFRGSPTRGHLSWPRAAVEGEVELFLKIKKRITEQQHQLSRLVYFLLDVS